MYRLLTQRLQGRVGGQKTPPAIAELRGKVLRNPKWRLAMYRKLASNYRAKVSFAQTLTTRAKTLEKRDPSGTYTRIVRHWADRAGRAGIELHDVLAGWVPPLEQQILTGSEDEQGLDAAIWFLQKQLAGSKAAKAAMMYPLFLVLVLFASLFVIGSVILPRIYQATQNTEDHTLVLAFFRYAWVVAIPLFGGGALIISTFSTWTGDTRTWFDLHMWPYTVWRRRQGQAFLFAYSSLLKRKNEVQALNDLTANARPWHRQRISAIAYHITEGLSFGAAGMEAGHGFPDPELLDTLEDMKADQKDMADILRTFAEESKIEEDDRQNAAVMLLSQGVMALVIVCIAIIAAVLINSFDISGVSDALSVH